MFHSSVYTGAGGKSDALPSVAPAATDLAIVSLCATLIRRAGRTPLGDRLLVRDAEHARTDEGAVTRIGMPRRHRAVGNLARDRLRPRTRVLVGQERHRRNVAGAMAARAIREQYGRDVLAIRRRSG